MHKSSEHMDISYDACLSLSRLVGQTTNWSGVGRNSVNGPNVHACMHTKDLVSHLVCVRGRYCTYVRDFSSALGILNPISAKKNCIDTLLLVVPFYFKLGLDLNQFYFFIEAKPKPVLVRSLSIY